MLFWSDVSRIEPSNKTTRMERIVLYEFCAVPQHMPEELLFKIPPTNAVASVAGSGPILRLYGFNKSFASEPITPHSHFKALPSSITSIFLKPSLHTISTSSLEHCPDNEEPAARNVNGVPHCWHRRIRRRTSRSSSAFTTTFGK